MFDRINRLKNLMYTLKIDSILIQGKANKKYIGALTGSGVKVFVTKKSIYQILDGRYIDEAKKKTNGFEIIDHGGDFYGILREISESENIKSIGIEGSQSLATQYIELIKNFDYIELLKNELESLRAVKDKEEIEKVKKACEVTDIIFNKVIKKIKIGVTEQEIAAEINYTAMKLGASGMSFDTIVASGYRSAMPHGRPTDKKIECGDSVVLDFGIVLDGYQSDMTRTVFVSNVPDKLKEIYEIVLEAQLKGISAIKNGAIACDVDKVARDYIASKGYGEYFNHGLGHGMGMGEGEMPTLNKASKDILKDGMIMSCEPGIYIPDLGGVRIEDDVVIVDGKGVPLNSTTKKLLVI